MCLAFSVSPMAHPMSPTERSWGCPLEWATVYRIKDKVGRSLPPGVRATARKHPDSLYSTISGVYLSKLHHITQHFMRT